MAEVYYEALNHIKQMDNVTEDERKLLFNNTFTDLEYRVNKAV
jgi:hypothetical protein